MSNYRARSRRSWMIALLAFVSAILLALPVVPGGQASAQECIATTSRLDVTFLIDQSGSMSPVIDQATREASAIANRIRSIVPDSAFAVASFNDYPLGGEGAPYGRPGDQPFTLQSNINTDTEALARGLSAIRVQNGGDGPEAYARAIDEMPGLAWRDGARRVVVLMGDAYPHSKGRFGDGRPDPGRDGVPNTADDIEFVDAVANARSAGISIIGFQFYNSSLATAAFQYAAEETGGTYLLYPGSGSLADLISGLVAGVLCEKEPPSESAKIYVAQRPTANHGTTASSIVTSEIVVGNIGKGAAKDVTISVPFDPSEVRVLDAKFTSSSAWVSEVLTDSLTIRTGPIGSSSLMTATLRMQVLDGVAAGTSLAEQLTFTWRDGVSGGKGKSNTPILAIAGAMDHRPTYTMAADTPAVKAGGKLTFSSNLFVPEEPVGVWYNKPDGTIGKEVGTFRASPDGGMAVEFTTPADLPPGSYSMVFYGHWTQFTVVAPFTITP